MRPGSIRPNNMGKHRRFGKTAAIVAAVIGGVGALGVWGVTAVSSRLSLPGQSGVQTVEVQGGTIESTVAGTGTLEYEDARAVTVPAGLEISSVLQGEGRRVEVGQLLATVDRTACEARMTETYGQIAAADQQMLDMPQEAQTVNIAAPVAGYVSVINAARGSTVLDVLAADGALAVISTDGRKGVVVETDDPAAALPGETVLVAFTDGHRVSATVDEVTESGFTAVLGDPSADVQQEVTVLTPRGEAIGAGTTAALDTVDVVGPAGTVEDVRVSAGARVSAGDIMFTVRPSGKSAECAALEQQRAGLTKEYDQLAVIAKNGGIVAPVSGTIVTCNVTAGQNTSVLEGASGGFSPGSSGGQISFSAQDALGMFGAGMNAPSRIAPGQLMLSADGDGEEHDDALPEETEQPPDQPSMEGPPDAPATVLPTEQPAAPTQESVRSIPRVEVPIVPPIPVLPLQTELAVLPVYTGTVDWHPADVQAQYATVYTADVCLKAMEGFAFAPDCTAAVLSGELENVVSTGTELTFTVTYPKTPEKLTLPDIDWQAIQDFLDAGGSLDLSGLQDLLSSGLLPSSALGFDMSSLYSQIDPSALYGQIDPSVLAGTLDASSLAGYDASSLMPNTDSIYSSVQDAAGFSEPIAYTIAPDDTMQLVIQINQMDILSVHPGMRCTVTVDAIPDTEFEGTVSEVSQATSSDGDYTAQIVLQKDDRMRPGMTAAATIVTQETADVLTLPVAALQEDGNRVFVYTGYDASSDELTDALDVETGVSNGSEVEILDGLEAGQTVYYKPPDAMREMIRMMTGEDSSSREDDSAQSTYVHPAEAIATP